MAAFIAFSDAVLAAENFIITHASLTGGLACYNFTAAAGEDSGTRSGGAAATTPTVQLSSLSA